MPSTEHKTIDGSVLSAEREKTGLSQAAFASECGYSQQYQQQLETSGRHEITSAKAEQILAVPEKYK
jgi:transcriptional regulator with XRE-family HTH domain